MVKIFFHTRTSGKKDWDNRELEFSRVPSVGEYVCLETTDENYHQVELVVHTPFHCPYDAEVFAVAENHMEAMKSSFTG
jgi:hypothetical protein